MASSMANAYRLKVLSEPLHHGGDGRLTHTYASPATLHTCTIAEC